MKTQLKVKLITHTPNAEELIATAAKLCYSELGIEDIRDNLSLEEIIKFLDMTISMGHESPIEHVSFTFGLEGVSRSLTHQLVRHRHASYSQKSQRYVREGQFEYVIPPQIANKEHLKYLYLDAMMSAQKYYDDIIRGLLVSESYKVLEKKHFNNDKLINDFKNTYPKKYREAEKRAIEDARYVLPNACETKIIVTMNARELLHFFRERCCNRAQWEIREMATEMLVQVKDIAPFIFKHAGPKCLNKPCPEGTMSCGKIRQVRSKFKD